VVSLDLLLFGPDPDRYERGSERTPVARRAAWSF
jgi:hypothetical protein